jgi:hypothetical protein
MGSEEPSLRGIADMHRGYTSAPPGQNAEKDLLIAVIATLSGAKGRNLALIFCPGQNQSRIPRFARNDSIYGGPQTFVKCTVRTRQVNPKSKI